MKKTLYKEERNESFFLELQTTLSPLPHIHNLIEIVWVEKGFAIAHADRNIYELSDGDIFITFPNQVHYYENSVDGKYGVLIISVNMLFKVKDFIFDTVPENNLLKAADCFDEKLLEDLFKYENDIYGETIVAGILNQIFGHCLSKIKLKKRLKSENFTLQNILNYCTLNFASNITLDDIANELHLSKYYVSYLFNNKLGLSFSAYLSTLRVSKARDLIEESDEKMANIALDSGFSSIRSFNRAFYQVMGETPSDYRKKFRI